MKKIVRLTESDLIRLVKRVINEQVAQDKTISDKIARCGVAGGFALIMKFPKCFALAKDLMDGKVGLFDGIERMTECKNELSKATSEDYKNVMKILECLAGDKMMF